MNNRRRTSPAHTGGAKGRCVLMLLLGVVALFVGAIGLALSQLQGGSASGSVSRTAGDDLGFPGDWHPGSPSFASAQLDLDRRTDALSEPPLPLALQASNRSKFCGPWPTCALPAREPAYQPLCSLLDAWSPNDSIPPNQWTQASDPLPRFNFNVPAELALATQYREAELPFVLRGVPKLDEASKAWTDAFLRASFATMGRGTYKVERSMRQGHFLYYKQPRGLYRKQSLRGSSDRNSGWAAPQEAVDMTYAEFEKVAKAADHSMGLGAAISSSGGSISSRRREQSVSSVGDKLYLTISAGMGAMTAWVVESLPFFRDDRLNFRVNYPESFHGINCRFGMRGVVQAAHYDHGQNFIAMVRGHKRYIILAPEACSSLELLAHDLPSGRHASFDWADSSERATRRDKPFCQAQAAEVIIGPGDVLYLPSYWFHYIVSLDRAVQCNSRAGETERGEFEIADCMRSHTTEAATGF